MSDNSPEEDVFSPKDIVPAEFEIMEPLGRGGSGLVFKAQHLKLGATVAIKFIRSTTAAVDKSDFARFHKEVRAIAGLNHPNIVRILQVGKARDSTPFIVYEYLAGETLRCSHESGPATYRNKCV